MLHLPFISSLVETCRSVFSVAKYAYTSTPTYPSGQIGFMVCCKADSDNNNNPTNTDQHNMDENKGDDSGSGSGAGPSTTRDVTKPIRWWPEDVEEKLCRYYNRRVHEASFVLPTFARGALQ